MEINIDTKFNFNDIVYVVLQSWETETETFKYYAPKKPAQVKGIDILTQSEYIISNNYGKVTTTIKYHFKNFDNNFLCCNSLNERMCFSTWEQANDYAKTLNNI